MVPGGHLEALRRPDNGGPINPDTPRGSTGRTTRGRTPLPARPHPYVSRGPRPDTCRGPLRQLGAAGPWIRIRLTTPLPTTPAILTSNCPCSNRNCVAQAVEVACTVSSPSRSAIGWACSATSSPTSCVHCPNTCPVASRVFQPRSTARRETILPKGCGSRWSEPAPDHLRLRGFCPRPLPAPPPRPAGFGRRTPGSWPRVLAFCLAASRAALARSRPLPSFGPVALSPFVSGRGSSPGRSRTDGGSDSPFGRLVTPGDNPFTVLSTLSTGLSPDRGE